MAPCFPSGLRYMVFSLQLLIYNILVFCWAFLPTPLDNIDPLPPFPSLLLDNVPFSWWTGATSCEFFCNLDPDWRDYTISRAFLFLRLLFDRSHLGPKSELGVLTTWTALTSLWSFLQSSVCNRTLSGVRVSSAAWLMREPTLVRRKHMPRSPSSSTDVTKPKSV